MNSQNFEREFEKREKAASRENSAGRSARDPERAGCPRYRATGGSPGVGQEGPCLEQDRQEIRPAERGDGAFCLSKKVAEQLSFQLPLFESGPLRFQRSKTRLASNATFRDRPLRKGRKGSRKAVARQSADVDSLKIEQGVSRRSQRYELMLCRKSQPHKGGRRRPLHTGCGGDVAADVCCHDVLEELPDGYYLINDFSSEMVQSRPIYEQSGRRQDLQRPDRSPPDRKIGDISPGNQELE